MNSDFVILGTVVALGVIALSLWSARRIDRQHARAAEILRQSEEQQSRQDDMLRRSEALQARETAMLDRWDAVLTRIETLADRPEPPQS